MEMSSPLYLTLLQHFQGKEVWYTQSPVGINQRDNLMTKFAGLTCTIVLFIKHKVRVNIYTLSLPQWPIVRYHLCSFDMLYRLS